MRGLIIGKKGAAHFEMIVSFVFFVGFVLFLFMVLKPQDTSTLSGAVISGLYDSFEERAYTNLSSVLLRANYIINDGCFAITLPEHIFDYRVTGENSRSYVARVVGGENKSDLDYGRLEIDKYDYGERVGGFYRVAISPEFKNDDIDSCEPLEDGDFLLGSIIERKVISYRALEAMEVRYSSDYEALRSDLRVPAIFDFAIVSEGLGIEMEPEFGIPDSVEVMAQNRRAEVLYKNGTIVNGRFILKIW